MDFKGKRYRWLLWLGRILVIGAPLYTFRIFYSQGGTEKLIHHLLDLGDIPYFLLVPPLVHAIVTWIWPLPGGVACILWGLLIFILFYGGHELDPTVGYPYIFLTLGGMLNILWAVLNRKAGTGVVLPKSTFRPKVDRRYNLFWLGRIVILGVCIYLFTLILYLDSQGGHPLQPFRIGELEWKLLLPLSIHTILAWIWKLPGGVACMIVGVVVWYRVPLVNIDPIYPVPYLLYIIGGASNILWFYLKRKAQQAYTNNEKYGADT